MNYTFTIIQKKTNRRGAFRLKQPLSSSAPINHGAVFRDPVTSLGDHSHITLHFIFLPVVSDGKLKLCLHVKSSDESRGPHLSSDGPVLAPGLKPGRVDSRGRLSLGLLIQRSPSHSRGSQHEHQQRQRKTLSILYLFKPKLSN